MGFLTPAANRRSRQTAIARNRSSLCFTVDSVLAVIGEASATEEETGLTWYQRAHNCAAELVPTDPTVGAGIIAALSPQTPWETNLGLALELVTTGDCRHYPDAAAKAQRIVAGAPPLDVLGGRKVRSFFHNIAYPDRSGPVTVDRHALAIVLGVDPDRRTHSSYAHKRLERVGVYQLATSAYRGAGRTLGLRPHEVQAIAWTTWRRLTGADRRFDTGETF